MELFKPKYQLKVLIASIGLPIFSVILLVVMYITKSYDISIVLIALFMIVLTVLLLMVLIKEIEFSDKIYIKKYILPRKSIEYSEIEWISLNLIKVKGFYNNIGLQQMENSDQLTNIIKENIQKYQNKKDIINQNQIKKEIKDSITMLISIGLTIPIVIVLSVFNILPTQWNIKIVFLIIWIIVTCIVYFIRRKTN